MHKLTELYLPTTKNQKQKMIEYNRERMLPTMGDAGNSHSIENEVARDRKRKLKEEVKAAREKLKHRIKFSNPGPLLDEALHFYTPGMTSKQID